MLREGEAAGALLQEARGAPRGEGWGCPARRGRQLAVTAGLSVPRGDAVPLGGEAYVGGASREEQRRGARPGQGSRGGAVRESAHEFWEARPRKGDRRRTGPGAGAGRADVGSRGVAELRPGAEPRGSEGLRDAF